MPKRKVIKREITKEQFLTILGRACEPIEKSQPDSEPTETSELHHPDDYNEKYIHSSKTEDI